MSIDSTSPSSMTGPGWEGLRLETSAANGSIRRVHVVVDEARLVLHDLTGRRYRVRWQVATWEFSATAGLFDFLPAGAYEVVDAGPDPMRARVVRIPPAFHGAMQDERGAYELTLPRFQFADSRLSALVNALVKCNGLGPKLSSADAIVISIALVDRLCEAVGGSSNKRRQFSPVMKRVLAEYIDDHVGDPLNSVTMGTLVGLAKSQFGATFKDSFGLPLHRYVLARKIELARSKLTAANVNVSTLAHDLGFSSHSHFTTHFRKTTGQTPSQFRDAFVSGLRRNARG